MADASFIFETNISSVSKEIEAGLRRIQGLASATQGAQGGAFVSQIAPGVKKDVQEAIQQLRSLRQYYEQLGKGGKSLGGGEATFSVRAQEIITALNEQLQKRVREAAGKAGADLGDIQLGPILRELDQAFTRRARTEARRIIAEAEKGGTGALFGSRSDVPTGIPKSNIGSVGDVQRANAAANSAAQEKIEADKAAAKATRERGKAEERLAKQLDSVAEQERQALEELKRRSGAVKGLLSGPPTADAQFVNGRASGFVQVKNQGPDLDGFYKQQGQDLVRLHEKDLDYIKAQEQVALGLAERQRAEKSAAEASERLASKMRADAAQLGLKDTSLFGQFKTGLTSHFGGGDSGQQDPLGGLAYSAGTAVKYGLLYGSVYKLLGVLTQVGQEFLNVDDSITELNIAMGDGVGVSGAFVNSLQDVAAPGGFNVGDAMDQAAAAMRAYGQEGENAVHTNEEIGVSFAKAAAQVAVIAKTDLPNAFQNTRAAVLGFDLNPLTGPQQVADAVAGSKKFFGGKELDISQGTASAAEVSSKAGFSLNETAALVAKISSNIDESGQLAATRFSRIVATLQGSSGKSALANLNRALAPTDQIDTTASVRDQVEQLAVLYKKADSGAVDLSESQKQQLETALAGTQGQREFNVLLADFPNIAAKAKQGFVGLASKEYEERLKNIRGRINEIVGDLRAIITNVAESGILEPFVIAVGAAKEVLDVLREVSKVFNLIPDAVKETAGILLGVLATMKAISVVSKAGGLKGFFGGIERAAFPQRALARTENVIAGADATRGERLQRIVQDETAGRITPQNASKLRADAEREYQRTINDARRVRAKAETDVTDSVSQGASKLRASFTRLRGDQIGKNLTDLSGAIGTGASKVKTAVGGFSLGGAARAAGRGVGGLLASEIGPLGGALIAADIGVQIKDTFDSISRGLDTVKEAGSSDIGIGAAELRKAADANATAAQQLREASGGFFGFITDKVFNLNSGDQVDRAQRRADQEYSLANQVEAAVKAAQNSTKTTDQAAASKIDTSSADRITQSFQELKATGASAAEVMHSLSAAMATLRFVASNNVNDLNASQRVQLGGNLGIGVGNAVDARRDQLRGIIDAAGSARSGARAGSAPSPQKVAAQNELDYLNSFRAGDIAKDVTAHSLNAFSKQPGNGDLGNAEVQKRFREFLTQKYITTARFSPETAKQAADAAIKNLPGELEKLKGDLAKPEDAQAFVEARLQNAQDVGTEAAQRSQLNAFRTGTKDRSAGAGLKATLAAQKALAADVQNEIKILASQGKDSSALLNLLGYVNRSISDTAIKILQDNAAQAKEAIDFSQHQRDVALNATKSASEKRAIGLSFFKKDIATALKSGDAELIRSVIGGASAAEIASYKRQLQDNLAAAEAEFLAEQRRDAAFRLLSDYDVGGRPDEGTGGLSGVPHKDRPGSKSGSALNDVNKFTKDLGAFNDAVNAVGKQGGGGKFYGDSSGGGSKKDGPTAAQIAAARAAAEAERRRDSLGAARAAVAAAKADVAAAKDQLEKYKALQQQYAAQNALSDLLLKFSTLRLRANSDLTDPVAQARIDLIAARRKLARDRRQGASRDVIDQDRIDVKNAENTKEAAAFNQRLSDAQTNDQLGRISHKAYLQYLQNEHNRLSAIKVKTRQQKEELDQIDQAIKAGNDALQGQFNLGDIKVPTVYEVRRAIAAQTGATTANAITNSVVNNNQQITVNGADFAKVLDYLKQALGPQGSARLTVQPRKG